MCENSRLKQIVYFKRPITHKNGPGNVLYQWFETIGAFSNGCFRTFLAAALTFLAAALNAPCALLWKHHRASLAPRPKQGSNPRRANKNARASLTPCGHMHAYHPSQRKQKREGIADMGDLFQGNMAPQGKQKREGHRCSSRSRSMVGHQGFEPWALGLKVPCSAS